MRHSPHVEKWDINGTWNVSFPACVSKTLEKQGFTQSPFGHKWDIGPAIGRLGNGTKMGHKHLTAPIAELWSSSSSSSYSSSLSESEAEAVAEETEAEEDDTDTEAAS